jgi:glycosyltransferase involved in cell wall biosynthesis
MAKKTQPFLSLVLPIFNEKDTLAALIHRCVEVLEGARIDFEILAVDDCSTDGTLEVLNGLVPVHKNHLKVLHHPYNKGNGASVKDGIKAARGVWICCMDADGQHDPEDILKMLEQVENYDLIVGARPFGRQKQHRELANRLYNALATWVTHFRIQDLTSGFRLFRASVIKRFVHLFPAGFSYPTTSTLVLLKTGHNVAYLPINIQPRQGGKSKIHLFKDGTRFFLLIFKIMLLFDPIRVFLILSMSTFLLSLVSSIYSSITIGALHVPNSSVILALVGALLLILGFFSEQITSLQLTLLENIRPEEDIEND